MLPAQTILHLRYGAGPKITITGATNATPIQITTSTPHGFSAGDVVWIWGIEGNWNADGTRRVKTVVDPTHFTIAYCGDVNCSVNGADAAGNGTYAKATRIGSWCGSTVAYPIRANPILLADGPTGANTLAMAGSGSTLAPRAQPTFGPWAAITDWLSANSIETNYAWNGSKYALFRGGGFGGIIAMALHWFSDRTQTNALNGATYWIQNAQRIVETLACDETVAACGNSTDSDYSFYYAPKTAQVYSLVRDQLISTDRATFLDKMLNDRTDGATCSNGYVAGTGHIIEIDKSLSVGADALMYGSGTDWTTSLSPGDVIFPAGYNPWTVVSVDSDTQIHYRTANLASPNSNVTGLNATYQIAHDWVSGNCGWGYFQKHQGYSSLSPGGAYPTQGGIQLSDLMANQFLSRESSFMMVGLATANDDARGARMAEGSANWWQDVLWPLHEAFWTGAAQIDSQYGPDRFMESALQIAGALKNSTGGAVDYLSDRWLRDSEMLHIYYQLPTSTSTTPLHFGYGLSNFTQGYPWKQNMDLILPYLTKGSTEAGYMGYWRSAAGVGNTMTQAYIEQGACVACWYAYMLNDPSDPAVDYTSLPTARNFSYQNAEGHAFCPTCGTDIIVSRTSHTDPNATALFIDAMSQERSTNHISTSGNHMEPGGFQLFKHHMLIGGDVGSGVHDASSGYFAPDQQSNYFEVGGANNLISANGYPSGLMDVVTVPRYSDGGGNKYMYALVDASGAYTAAANLSRMNRHFVDFKGGAEQYIVVYDDVATAVGELLRTYTHYPNNGQSGEGLTTYNQGTNSAVSLDAAGGARLNTAWFFPGAPGFTYMDNPDGSYTGGAGETARVSACIGTGTTAADCSSAATAGEILTVHQPSMNQSLTMPSFSLSTASNFRVLQILSPVAPKVAAFAQAGSLQNSLSVPLIVSGTAQILVAGLNPGSYTATSNGSVVGSCTVVANDNSCYVEAAAGPFQLSAGLSVLYQMPPQQWQIQVH